MTLLAYTWLLMRAAITQEGSEAMTYSTFNNIVTETGNPLSDADVKEFFTLVDDEHDGLVRLDEFMKVRTTDNTKQVPVIQFAR
jgi:Ca2+-binding EF-hand superfamily protein